MLSSLTDVCARYQGVATSPSTGLADGDAGLSLRAALASVPDPRAKRGVRYAFTDLLLTIVCAVFSGARSLTMVTEWAADAASRRGLFASGAIPSIATIHRVAARLDPVRLDAIIGQWAQEQARVRAIAVDGKEVRGAKNASGSRVFLMAALDHATGCVIGQESIGAKTNEIPHFHALMGTLGDLNGIVVTADALHTQREHAQYLHSHGAHYVFTVKDNQRGLRQRISSQTWAGQPIGHTRREKSHGRTTTWQATTQTAQAWIDFPPRRPNHTPDPRPT